MMILLNLFLISILCYASGSSDECVPSVHPPERNSGCCGVGGSSFRIIPGFFASIDEYPWMALVEYKRGNETKLHCSAVLISGRYALSAAHCFPANTEHYGSPVNIRLGDYDISNEGLDCVDEAGSKYCNDGALTIPIEKVIIHPEYRQRNKKESHEHNIALIKLKETAPYTDFIRPICLPTSDVTLAIKEGPVLRHFMLAGWSVVDTLHEYLGTRNILHHVHVPFVDSATCNSAYKDLTVVGNGHICAGGEGRGSCQGDSGSPLMYRGDDTFELAGIVSFGARACGTIGTPDVYTKVFPYVAWIQENIVD